MPLSMYEASVPVFLRGLGNLRAILEKAEDYAKAKKIEEAVLINARLAPDMFPLARQVQIASDVVKGAAARLAGVEVPSYPDAEATFAELRARIDKTVTFLETFTAQQIDGSEDRTVSLKVRSNEVSFKGKEYLFAFVLPNFYFHETVAYSILRHNGLDIGKKDFLGTL